MGAALKKSIAILAIAPWAAWWLWPGVVSHGLPLWLWTTLAAATASGLLILYAVLRSAR